MKVDHATPRQQAEEIWPEIPEAVKNTPLVIFTS